MMKAALAVYTNSPGSRQKIAMVHSDLSEMFDRKGNTLQSEEEAREALAAWRGQQNVEALTAEIQLARAVLREGRMEEGEAILRKASAESQRLPGVQTGQLLGIKMLLAPVLAGEGRITDAEKLTREALSLSEAKFGTNSLQTADMMSYLVDLVASQGNFVEADGLSRQCVAIARKMAPSDHPELEKALWLLGRVLRGENKDAEAAKVFRETLEIRRKIFGEQDARVMETAALLAQTLIPDGDETKLENLAKEVPEVWGVMAENMAGQGQWPGAMAAASKLMSAQPTNHAGYHLMAPLLVQTGDRTAYEDLCGKMTTLFAGAKDPRVADRMAKDCLILSRPGADLTIPSELAETAVTLGAGQPRDLPYFQCCKALAEFREGHFEEAKGWAQRVIEHGNACPRAEAEAILAMSEFRLKRSDASRTALKKCDEIVESQKPKLATGNWGEEWRDWIIVQALLKEAVGMIGGPGQFIGDSAEK